MKILKTIIAIAILSISCSKDNDATQLEPSKETTDVFLLTQESISGKYTAKYWKNDVATTLNSDINSSINAAKMVVDNTNVYVSGSETSSGFTFPCYWKNTTKFILPAPSPQPIATGIAVEGNNVYTCGTSLIGNVSKAIYWKNQNYFEITNGSDYSSAEGIAVSGTKIYVIGLTQSSQIFYSRLWIDGIPQTISSLDSRVSSIIIKENNIYISGKEKNSSGIYEPKYWIYNLLSNMFTKIDLPTNSTSITSGTSALFLNGTDIYVVGFERNASGRDFATYWKNGQKVVVSDGTIDADLSGIQIYENNVYVCGNDGNTVKIWKNNNATNYSDGTNLAFAKSIFVAEK